MQLLTNIYRCLTAGTLLLFSTAGAQQRDTSRYRSFSDFHIHTSFKNYYRFVKDPDSTILHAGNAAYLHKKYGHTDWIAHTKKPKDKKHGKESNMSNYDQCNYANLQGLRGSVLCMSITPPEKIMLSSPGSRWMNLHFVTHMSMKRQEVLAAENNSSFKEFMGEYYYAIHQDSVHNGTKILIAKNNADLRRIVAEGGIGLVITAEGGHVLFGNEVLSRIDSIKDKDCGAPCRAEILGNIEKMRQLPHRVFFITVAHFGWNKMFGNAKSLDKPGLRRGLLTAASLSDDFRKNVFAKYGEGIIGQVQGERYRDSLVTTGARSMKIRTPYTPDEYRTDIGYAVMCKLLDAEHDYQQPIYIDVKHMDLRARFEYYAFIDSVNTLRRATGKPLIPIIASHIGLSGKRRPVAMATGLYPLRDSYEELIFGRTFYKIQANERDQYWRSYTQALRPEDRARYFGDNPATVPASFNPFDNTANFNTLGWFYPWGINFCDEEIRYIYQSDGIVGLNLDRRILGFTMPNYTWRYKLHLKRIFRDLALRHQFKLSNGHNITFEDYYRAEPLLRNIFHTISVCGRQDASAWDHVAIGSDYDGFIQPLQLAPTTESIPLFHEKMVAFVQIFTEIHNQQRLLYGLSPETVMHKFFYTNGRDFIFKYFQKN
ncbi:hypothetical protein [Chitinophaga nivalis]|uniref:DUF3604 domain-containing protein n=1 Tax=Chitinophaga nivalis TaxID=2991709 RepID=A0ABT3INI7_9BACT|nr:hypothetical protein [Chitinophaga nivalis]MCW3464806.1 hypothetical protein [Chitinophaga nivalis]MCW3485503.1 hypothetical protein [Chitinophaga nivalis]